MSSERPRERLLIGEAAQLLGITPKTIRHYEKLGLLATPERTESGYRFYTADDLLRLHKIKSLQALGLSLERIKGVLGESGSGLELRGVLEALLGEVEGQISTLENRRARLQELLAEGNLPETNEKSYMSKLVQQYLGERWTSASPELLSQADEFWKTLDEFRWPEGYKGFQKAFVRYLADHPEEFEKLLSLEERFVALADVPEDSPEVESLAAGYAAHFASNPLPQELAVGTWAPEPVEHALSGVMLGSMSPAQKRCMELLWKLMEGGPTG